ncbi:hypothetical protein ADL35_45595, partial [Streptomyces sp. NRRL WC-3753]
QGLAELRDGGLRLRLVLAATSDSKTPLQPPAGSPLLPPPADPASLRIRSVEPVLPPAVTSAAGAMGATAMTGEAAAAYGGTGAGRSATGGGEATGTDTSGTDAAGTGAAEASAQGARPRVRAGFDRLAADGYALLSGRRIGIVTNPTGVTPDVRH